MIVHLLSNDTVEGEKITCREHVRTYCAKLKNNIKSKIFEWRPQTIWHSMASG